MFTRVEVQNFRSLRDVSVSLSNFQVLVGANGSGKTTFLDVFVLMRDFLSPLGLEGSIKERANNWEELTFQGVGEEPIWFGFEARLPSDIQEGRGLGKYDAVRYEIGFQASSLTREVKIIENCFLFLADTRPQHRFNQRYEKAPIGFPIEVLYRTEDGGTEFPELFGLTPVPTIWELKLDGSILALANVPDDVLRFPITTWLKNQFKKFLQPIQIDSDTINKAGKEGRFGVVNADGSNLPWLIDSLKRNDLDRYELWLNHVKTVLPNIESISTVAREDQGDKFLKIKYQEGNEVKSWMISDGTLRILLLTIIPYHLNLQGLFLIEEPETGIYPQAIQAVMDSLRSVYESQVLVTTHSPEAVNCVKKEELLVFVKNLAGETEIVSGADHPYLKNSKGDIGSEVFYGPGIMS